MSASLGGGGETAWLDGSCWQIRAGAYGYFLTTEYPPFEWES